MRTLNKTLSLVLAIVMIMSLCTIGAAAASTPSISDFSDSSAIQNKEAVAVMTGTGVINGMDGGFDPTGILTREQAAKIITYMVLGASQAEALSANTAPFADVAADRWSAGYISYCESEDIIAGVGNGNFDPTAQLTGYQWAKMLLVALGYDPAVEGYTGSSWAISVAKKALAIGLFDGNIDGNFTVPATRDEACLYAFNALTADMVEYKTNGTAIVVGDTSIITGGSSATKVEQASTATNYDGTASDKVMQFCEQYWPKLALKDTATIVNSFGAPSSQWKYKGETIGTYAAEADGTVVVSSTSSTTKKTLKYWIEQIDSDYELDEEVASTAAYTQVFVNGDEFTKAATYATAVYDNANTPGVNKAKLDIGDIITVYDTDDDNVIDTVLVKKYQAAKINSVDTNVSTTDASNDITAYITVNNVIYKPGTDTDGDKLPGFSATTYVKNAILGTAYMYDAATGAATTQILDSYVATNAEGTVSAYTAPTGTVLGNITVAGTKYTFNNTSMAVAGNYNSYGGNDFTGTYAVYTDANGYAIYVKTVESGNVASDALYANYIYSKTAKDTYDVTNTTYYAQVVDMTGATSVLTLGYTTSAGKIYGNVPCTLR